MYRYNTYLCMYYTWTHNIKSAATLPVIIRVYYILTKEGRDVCVCGEKREMSDGKNSLSIQFQYLHIFVHISELKIFHEETFLH